MSFPIYKPRKVEAILSPPGDRTGAPRQTEPCHRGDSGTVSGDGHGGHRGAAAAVLSACMDSPAPRAAGAGSAYPKTLPNGSDRPPSEPLGLDALR